MFDKTRFDDAVSPVVGVILMVAVTVILAAVIGSFVLDLGSNVEQNPNAGVTFDQSPTGQIDTTTDSDDNPDTQTYEVTVNAISVENADSVKVQAADNDDSQNVSSGSLVDYDPQVSGSPIQSAGDSATVTQLTEGDTVTVVGELNGKEAVIQTHTVE